MDFLKKNNWWLCLLINIITCGLFYMVLGKIMKLYDKDAWYMNKWYWILGAFFLITPSIVLIIDSGQLLGLIGAPFSMIFMIVVFSIQMNAKVAASLGVSGSRIYNTPYTWLLFIIIPIFGWVLLFIMLLYIIIMPNIKLAQGYGEKFIK